MLSLQHSNSQPHWYQYSWPIYDHDQWLHSHFHIVVERPGQLLFLWLLSCTYCSSKQHVALFAPVQKITNHAQYGVAICVATVMKNNASLNGTWKMQRIILYTVHNKRACSKSLRKINVIVTLGGEGVLVHDVLQLHYQQTLAFNRCDYAFLCLDMPPAGSKFAF